MIAFNVPGAPQGKGRGRIIKMGKRLGIKTPEKTVAYEQLIAASAAEVMRDRPLYQGPVICALTINVPIPASWSKAKRQRAATGVEFPTATPDADNIIKAIFDGMNGVVWRDDAQVIGLSAIKRYSEQPCVLVEVSPAQ